jgi:hypothetical protein
MSAGAVTTLLSVNYERKTVLLCNKGVDGTGAMPSRSPGSQGVAYEYQYEKARKRERVRLRCRPTVPVRCWATAPTTVIA